ncbi:MAG: hypothetical protein WCK67_01285 [bacterium]
MSKIIEFRDKLLQTMTSFKYKDNENFLRIANAFNFSLLCGLQAVAIKINKEVPEDSKKFMIPQELIEGGIKICVFMGAALGFGFIGKGLVKSGLIIPHEVNEFITKYENKIAGNNKIVTNKDIGNFIKTLLCEELPKEPKKVKDLTDIVNTTASRFGVAINPDKSIVETAEALRSKINTLDTNLCKTVKNFHGAMGNLTNIAGMIVGLSILTPPLRNFVAKGFKEHMKKGELKKEEIISQNASKTSLNILENAVDTPHPLVASFKAVEPLPKSNLTPPPLSNKAIIKPPVINIPNQSVFQTFKI